MEKIKNILTFAVFCLIVLFLSVTFLVTPDETSSLSERRMLKTFSDVLESEKPFDEFESYFLDQFPFRDTFRTIKAMSAFYVLGKSDNNGIYIKDGYAAKVEYPLNEKSVERVSEKLSGYIERFFEDDVNVYLTIVPDKGYFLAEKNGYPAIDYQKMVSIMTSRLPFAKYIHIMDSLSEEDYYKTDTHWKQEKITDIAKLITDTMGTSSFESFTEIKTDVPFYGVYYGQAALPLAPDSISYLTNDILENCTVKAFDSLTNKIEEVDMYSMEHLSGKDPYEMYLYGATPYVLIENPAGEPDRELVIFRDSFGSSISPLLIKDYSKITILDTRYMQSDFIGNFIGKSTDDVLFIYSTLILNSGDTIK